MSNYNRDSAMEKSAELGSRPRDFNDNKKKEACSMGRSEAEGQGALAKDEGDTAEEAFAAFQSGVTQSAKWANFILPDLRSLAGCRDPSGMGTFTDCGEEARFLLNELLDTFWDCASQKIKEEHRDG